MNKYIYKMEFINPWSKKKGFMGDDFLDENRICEQIEENTNRNWRIKEITPIMVGGYDCSYTGKIMVTYEKKL